jgi:outer membrane receptor for ferric coprogen and ferric-rhodotorulic acid
MSTVPHDTEINQDAAYAAARLSLTDSLKLIGGSHVSVQVNGENLLDRKYFVLDQFDNTDYGAPANYSVSLRVAY